MATMWDTVHGIWKEFLSHLPLLAAGLLVILLTAAASHFGRRLAGRLLRRANLRQSLQELLQQIVFVLLWVLGLLLTAMVIFPGLTPTRALGGLGLLSIAVGFAFKDIFENFFSGILLLWRFPFEPKDFIECKNIVGRVERISIRMTTIRKPTDELIVVPNSFLLKNPVNVLTDRDERRVSIIAGVAYGVDLYQAVDVIRRTLPACDTVATHKPIQVFPIGFGSSSMDIEVAWWTDPTPLGERRSRGEVVAAIKTALDDNDLEIPFPYRTLTFKEPLMVQNGNDHPAPEEGSLPSEQDEG